MALPGIASFDDYGGEKQDYSPPEDVTTDRSAAEINPAFADVAAMTRMIPRAYVAFTADGGGPACTIVDSDAVWGNATAVLPVLTYNGDGDYTVEWPSTIVDELGNTVSVNLRRGMAQTEDLGFVGQVIRVSATEMRVMVYNANTGYMAAWDPTGPITLTVW